MKNINIQAQSKRGRKKHTDIDKFQTLAWFNSVSSVMGTDAADTLEKIIRSDKIIRRDGKTITSRAWGKYKNGKRLPKDGYKDDGTPETVIEAEMRVPESGDVYRHLIWKAMRTPSMQYGEVVDSLATFKPIIASYYFDLSASKTDKRKISLAQNLWMPIPVKPGDYYAALDHLAVNLMFLRLDIIRHLDFERREIALNIANTLGSVALSPWIGPFHEEMYDWLEANVWEDLFDTHYDRGNIHAKGWRRTRPDWPFYNDD